ncbi:hypothetical protein [Pseudomonas pergaminensis]
MALDQSHQNDSPSPSVDKSALEGPFLHADDAAYWAHRHIGGERSVEYGGVILKKGTRFFASIPQPSKGQFVRSDLVTVSPEGKMIFPDGYTPYAFYHSHPTQAQPAGQPTVSDEMWSVYSGMFSYADIERIIENGSVVPAHYLSGPGDALIKYVVSGSIRERELVSRLRPEDRRPFDFFTDYIPMMAGAGELSVVLASEAWGGIRGRVGEDWRMGVPLAADVLSPLFEKITSSPNFGDLLWERAGSLVGYQLKAIDKEEYLVMVKEWEPARLTSPERLFPLNPDGGVRLPANFRISSLYCWEDSRETPSSGHFFSPTLLAGVAEQLRTSPELYLQEPRLRLVMLSGDGALLSYRFSASDSEVQYLGRGGATVNAQLKEGRLTGRQFFLHMAGIGELETLRAGSSWLAVGRVLPELTLVDQLHATMSPAFITADDAARYLHDRVRDRSGEMLGLVFQRNDGRFVSTPPISQPDLVKYLGPADSSTFHTMALPSGYRIHGFFVANSLFDETQLSPQSDGTVLPQLSPGEHAALSDAIPDYRSVADMMRGDQKMSAFYTSSSLGSLVKYVRSGSQVESAFGAFLQEAIRTGMFKNQMDGFDGTPIEMVKKLARLGEFSVLVTSRVWGGSRGRVPAHWAPFKPFVAASPVPSLYSWIFQDAPTAATYGHDQLALTTGNQSVVFILKAVGLDQYVAALADAVSGLSVFSGDSLGHPVLVSGFELHGMCFSSRPALGQKVEQRWLYECFVAPDELAVAIAASREAGATVKTLYLNTRDGAQLEYQFSGTALESQLYGVTPTGEVNDNGHKASLRSGAVTPTEYVLRVAAAGELSVLVAGKLWDVQGRVEQTWRPFARYRMPEFSPPFLQADDAARFAHEQVGSERYGEYCGCILKTLDQRFVATLPVACKEEQRFAIGTVFPADHSGVLLVPEPYVLYGQYAACRSIARLDKARMRRNGWSREQASVDWQLFSDADLRNLIGNRHWVSTGYLSCDEHALIAFDLTGAKEQLDELNPDTSSAPREPQARVRHLSAIGLRIVLGSPLWGLPGSTSSTWRAYAPAATFEKPQQVAFGAVFSTAKSAVIDAHTRLRRSYQSAQTAFAFLLKHIHKDEYVVSEAVPADATNPLFTLASLFGNQDDGTFIYPPAFALHGLFYVRRWMPDNLQNPQRWLARYFLSSADLYSAFLAARRWRDKGSSVTLPVFISTLDTALLQYQTAVSTRLFDPEKQPSGLFEDVHTLLSGGQLSAQEFVKKVISMSWLSVLVPSECWDEEVARLGSDWIPYADFSRRALSPAFFHQADALRYAHQRLGNRRGRVYGGLLLKRVDGLFVATEPLPVATENFDPKWILPDEDVRVDWLAPGMTLVARYRSRQDVLPSFVLDEDGEAVSRAMFSTDVLGTAFTCQHLWSHEYLFGLDGSVIGFSCKSAMDATQQDPLANDLDALRQALAPAEQTPHDPLSNALEKQLRDGSLTPVEFVNRVLKVASMTVVQGSALWGNAQVLGRGWLPARGFITPGRFIRATADRALGPVFSHIDDAARDAHEHAGERDHLTYGFIFKMANGHCMASRPVDGEDRRFPYDRVLLGGRLPVGCTIAALYLCAPARQPQELGASTVYHAFIPPSLLRAALVVVRTEKNAGAAPYLPLYLSCADSALLKYSASRLDSDWDGESQLQAYIRTLNGNFNPHDYIRQVARAGQLEVLVTGAIWAGQGPVSQSWRAGTPTTVAEDPDARVVLGPLFSHPDDAARYMWRRSPAVPGKASMGAILKNAAGNSYLASEPVDDSGPSVHVGLRMNTSAYRRLFGWVMSLDERTQPRPKYPAGYRVMGVQQLHKWDASLERLTDRHEHAIAENFISQKEFRFVVDMLRQDKVAGARYYFTPRNGALLVYAPSFERAEHDLLLFGWVDPESDEPRLKASEALTVLFNSGRLHVLEPDRFWQPKGHVASRFLMALRKAQQAQLRS